MTEPGAPIDKLSPAMIKAICMLAGGSMAHLRGVYIDIDGGDHLISTIDALIDRRLVEPYVSRHKIRRVKLTDPRGRWFAATALARAADLLVAQQQRKGVCVVAMATDPQEQWER